jgi:hypothetical protein
MVDQSTHKRPERATYQDFYDAPWNAGLFRPFLIALIAASSVAGPLALARAFTPWRLAYVLPLALLVALEGVYSTNQLGRPRWRDRRGMLFRIGEIMFILVVLRLAEWFFSTGLPGLDDFALWLRHPGVFFDGQFVTVGLLLLMAWGLAVSIAGDFLDMAIQPDEVAAHDSAALSESRSQMRVFRPLGRTDIMARFATRWAWGAVLLVACAAFSRVEIATGGDTPLRFGLASLGLPGDILAALLCYFVAGLVLLSQSRLAVLRGRWYNQDIDVRPSVLRRWHLNALIALILVATIAALLPIGSTGPLSVALEAIMGLLMRLFYLMMMVFTLLLTALFYPFRKLFEQGNETPPMEVPEMEVPTQAEAINRLPDWLGGALLWLVVGSIVVYFLFSYLNAQGVFKGRWASYWQRFLYWWRARWFRISSATGVAVSRVRRRLRPAGQGMLDGASLRRVRVGRLPPRERVRYYYLKMVSRASERGVERPASATPLEFAQTLDHEWPDAETDISALTEAFLAARYAPAEIQREKVMEAQEIWRRVMRALRSKIASDARKSEG